MLLSEKVNYVIQINFIIVDIEKGMKTKQYFCIFRDIKKWVLIDAS